MSTALLLVHGRSQHLPAALRDDAVETRRHVDEMRRAWLAGLGKGATLAGLSAPAEAAASVAFYGNAFADAIDRHVAAGGRRPDLEVAAPSAAGTKDELIVEAAEQLGFDPARELSAAGPAPAELVTALAHRDEGLELSLGSVLRSKVVRSALQFIARKTGTPELIIEAFLTDVAYYLEMQAMREEVLGIVRRAADEALRVHDDVVLVGHSLGSVVAYDAFSAFGDAVPVRLLVTAGSPLGFPVVRRNLLPGPEVDGPRPAPAVGGRAVPWLNAFDVRDVVALVHPLAGAFRGEVRDERTHNPSGPHAITDYLADPDVARPIGRALAGKDPLA